MYEIEIRNDELHKFRVIRGKDRYVVEQKARAQIEQWDQMAESKRANDKKKRQRERAAQAKEAKKQLAADRTAEARRAVQQVEDTLAHTLGVDDTIDWGSIEDHALFAESPSLPPNNSDGKKPRHDHARYKPRLGLAGLLFPWVRRKRQRADSDLYQRHLAEWNQHLEDGEDWQTRKASYEEDQAKKNRAIDEQRAAYGSGSPAAVEDYCDLVLTRSEYPDTFPQEFEFKCILTQSC